MNRKQWLAVLVLVLLSLLFALPQMLHSRDDDKLSVAVAPQTGFAVISENPVTVSKGETAQFEISIDDGYSFADVSAGIYKDGILSIPHISFGQTVYLKLLKECSISLESSPNGSARLLGEASVIQGEQVSISLAAEPNYVPGPIEVNGTVYPAPSGDNFTFTAEDDSHVLVTFQGKPLDFLAVSGNLGYVKVQNSAEIYRFGDVLELECFYDNDTIIFEGWSVGSFLSEGGELISSQSNYRYTLTENTVLYANFSDRSSYRLTYDGNGGQLSAQLQEEHAPGEYLNLALCSDNFQREGYTLMGFSTQETGGNLMSPGSMFVMPREDVTLYAQWAQCTDPMYLEYTLNGSTATIRGFSEAGKEAQLNTLVIPATIEGRQVTTIDDFAFSGSPHLETIVLPVGLSLLNSGCFSDCPLLHTVYFPETLRYLSNDAFSGSHNFTNMRVIASLDRVYDYSYDSALAGKYMRLKNTEGKRIILVAGSNLAFGIDSTILQESFPEYSVVNLGVSALYGIMPFFDLLRANVREGDIVIFCPEYAPASYAAMEAESSINWQYLESNYDILKDLNMQNTPALLKQFPIYLSVKNTYLPGKKLNVDPTYAPSGFNQFGDMAVERNSRRSLGFTYPDPEVITDHGMALYNEVCRELTELGAHCCFSYAVNPSGGRSTQLLDSALADFEGKLKSKLDSDYISIISKMSDYFLSGDIFYDNPYHLTTEGAKLRTAQLVSDLKAYMEVLP